MPLTSNTLGQMYALTVLTPIAPGAEPALKAFLEHLAQDESPLAAVPGTHFGRWVIVPEFFKDPSQRKPEAVTGPFLIFSSTFDGPLDPYLDALATTIGDVAEQIWGRCIGAPTPARGTALKAYLLHNQIDTGLFFSAYPHATVGMVRESLRDRRRVIDFAVRAQRMDAAELHRTFLEEF